MAGTRQVEGATPRAEAKGVDVLRFFGLKASANLLEASEQRQSIMLTRPCISQCIHCAKAAGLGAFLTFKLASVPRRQGSLLWPQPKGLPSLKVNLPFRATPLLCYPVYLLLEFTAHSSQYCENFGTFLEVQTVFWLVLVDI